jgi:hypothetical protein
MLLMVFLITFSRMKKSYNKTGQLTSLLTLFTINPPSYPMIQKASMDIVVKLLNKQSYMYSGYIHYTL